MCLFVCYFFISQRLPTLQNKCTQHYDLLAAGLWYITGFVFVAADIMTGLLFSVPNIPLGNVSVCVSLVVSSGLQSSKGSVFPVTVLWQKLLHTVTRSDQPNQLSAGKSYTENVYDPLEHISEMPATCIKPACHTKIVIFRLNVLACSFWSMCAWPPSRILSSVLEWEMLICECWAVLWEITF